MATRIERLVVEAERRTLRAADEDGIGDLMRSPLFLFFALWFVVPNGYRLYVPIAGAATALGAWRAMEGIRRRFTYKRTGFVRLPRPSGDETWR